MTPEEKEWQPVKLERNREDGVVYFGDSLSDHQEEEG